MPMRIQMLGTGSASDPGLPNSSVVAHCGDLRIMIDCGYSVAREAIAAFRDPDTIDALVFTHHHPDHCFGFVPTMVAWADAGRRKPLVIAASAWGRRQLCELQRLGLGSRWQPGFDYVWHELPEPLVLGKTRLSFAPTDHSVPNHAIRIEAAGAVFAYSGDGRPTRESRALFQGADVLMHECYSLTALPDQPGHCTLDICAEMAATLSLGRLLLYHIHEDERVAVATASAAMPGVAVAETGTIIEVTPRAGRATPVPAELSPV